MVRIISLADLGVSAFDLGIDLGDGIDYRDVPHDYDWYDDVPLPPRPERGKRVIEIVSSEPSVIHRVEKLSNDEFVETGDADIV